MPQSNKVHTSPNYGRRGGGGAGGVGGVDGGAPGHFNSDRSPYEKNEWLKDNSIFTDIRTILFILKATGLLPIYEHLSTYEVGPPLKSNEFYSFFVRGVVHALTIFNVYSLFVDGGAPIFVTYRDSDNINRWIEVLLSMLTYSATVFICARNSRNLLRIINEILKVDEEIYGQYSARLANECGFSLRFVVVIFACVGYLVVLKLISATEEMRPLTYVLIALFAGQTVLTTSFIVFAAVLLRIVHTRFAYLNGILDAYTYTQQRKQRQLGINIAATMNAKPPIGSGAGAGAAAATQMMINTFPADSLFIYRMHNRLLRILKIINEFCSLILVAYMGYSFYTITTTTYNLFVLITTQRTISLPVLQWCFAWLSLHTSLLALLSKSCGQATTQANDTAEILARVYAKNKEFQNIIDKFLTKSIKQEVQFTAYGFFVIDNSTLFKIFSAVTTYLVILIQFKQLEESKLEDYSNPS